MANAMYIARSDGEEKNIDITLSSDWVAANADP
jgi:hypothetical protein